MTKSKGLLDIKFDVNSVLNQQSEEINTKSKRTKTDSLTVEKALEIIIRQMEVSGNRPRTIHDYNYYVNDFKEKMGAVNLTDISTELIYKWLDGMNVSNQTKLTRLKCLKAFLSRCFDNGWYQSKFWKTLNVKVDQKVKEGATDHEVNLLLSLLDLNNFVELRDAVAVLIMYKTGVRINTLSQLEEHHIDFENNVLILDGEIMKNHQGIKLPFDEMTSKLLKILIHQNNIIRDNYRKFNSHLFITKYGDPVSNSPTHNNIQKRLNHYSKEYGIKNINPHALRRGFAKNLLDKGAGLPLISKALGHSDLSVTTKYLYMDMEDVAKNLKEFLE
ncbi:tyrosine-type recombinase/integrase [Bacillus benzoevorans]|uniref:Site-specific recombinase XerD n=1 Tax=Bacillus benzoevorans TaxID=1456 RepID=A0A7X0HRL2_9BACI|nr:site-specific integrase [Bacillus benzoevorans]MBB6445638.1 site-specific recombinase XerD [Bacillus benzoevorans]